MDKEQTIKSLQKYCNASNNRFKDIFTVEYAGKLWNAATDGWRFIMILQNDENKIEGTKLNFPNLAAIIPEWNCYVPIKVSSLADAYNSIPIIKRPKTEECYNCNGEGEFYHEGYEYECKNCDGNGYIKTGAIEEVKDPDVYIKINSSTYNSRFIKAIIEDCQSIETITLVSEDVCRIGVFQITDEIIVGLMPFIKNVEEITIKTVAL